jgi:site-specific DNA-methyltransferase (adenine-specific)
MIDILILEGDVLEVLRSLPDHSVQTIITSPPYLWLRNYGIKGQIGLEKTPAEFIRILVEVFREIWRVPSENLFISFEPLLVGYDLINLQGIKQVIIGAQTNPKVDPPFQAIDQVEIAADKVGAKVFFKDSLPLHAKIRRELAWPLNKPKEVIC